VPRTEMTRLPEKGRPDRAQLDELLDSVAVAHVGLVADEHPLVVPTGLVRDGDRVLIHGSTGSRWMRTLAGGADACLTATSLDAVVVARSAFESSFRYRSAVLFGRFVRLDGAQKQEALDRVVDGLIPGRRDEVRGSTPREIAATLVLAMPIDRWSLRVSDGWPEDEDDDVDGPAWAGVVPIRTVYGVPVPAPDLRDGIDVPASVHALTSAEGDPHAS
jgi:uncharacterized protein